MLYSGTVSFWSWWYAAWRVFLAIACASACLCVCVYMLDSAVVIVIGTVGVYWSVYKSVESGVGCVELLLLLLLLP